MRSASWRVIGNKQVNKFDVGNIKRILKFSLGVSAISFAGLLLTQIDKLILSKTLGLEGFGQYMLATIVAGSLYILITPIFNTIYPRFSSLVAQENFEELLKQYRTASHLLASMLFPTAMIMVLLSQVLIRLWTGNPDLAANVAPLASFLLIGYALHGVMHIPYALMLAQGEIKSMSIIVPLTIVFSLSYGAVGGAIAQLLHFIFYLLLGTWIFHKKFLKGYAGNWLSKDIGVPLGISLLIGVSGYFGMPIVGEVVYVKLLLGILLWVVATILSILSSPFLRSIFVRYWNQFSCR
jgi:O-antigen/teichoic acid export membrane protein